MRKATNTIGAVQARRTKPVQPADKGRERDLVRAQEKIRKLHGKVADQQKLIRAMQARMAAMDSAIAERAELAAEIQALRGETKELTHANREQVRKNEALQAENARLRPGAKAREAAA